MRNQDGRQRWLTIGLVGGLVILGSMFVLWPAGGPEDGAASEEKQTAAPSNQGGGVSEDSGAASDPSADASATRAEVDPGDSISNEAGSVPVRGRVLGPDRRPVAGALLTVGCLLGESREIKSGADGSFSVLVVPPADRADPVSAVARHAVGVGSQSAYLREGKLELDLGAIVLRSVHGLRVRVMQDGTPVAAALVTLETPDRNVRLFSAVTDVIGEVFFEAAPERNLVVRAQKDAASGTTRAVPPGDQEVTLALAPDRDYELRVSDAEDAAPIGGALVACQQQFWMPAGGDSAFNFDGDYVRVRPDPARSTRTDEQGIAWIRGVGARDLLQLVVTAEGYPEPSEEVELRDDPVVQVRMTRKAGRTVRWPVVVGELAPPPQGTELEIRFVSGMVSPDEIHTAPGPALMQRGAIVLPGVEGVAHFLATAPDGAIAKLYCAEPESEGDPVTFRRPRSIEVTVRDAAGALVKGARVTARNQGNNELQAPVATNGNGVGVISGLYGGLASVSVAAPGDPGRGPVCGTIDLEQGDGRLEARLRSTARVRLRFQLDGVPGLPSSYRVSARGGCTVEAEDPVRAEVRVSAPVEDGFSGSITFGVRAEGFLDGRAEAFLSPGGGEAVADILLRRFGSLLVHVLRDPQEYVQISLEHEHRSTGEIRRVGQGLSVPNGPGGSFRFGRLESGVYRAFDERSKNTSASVQVVEGQPAAVVTLDISQAQWVSGRVITPPGVAAQAVRIAVEGEGLVDKTSTFYGGSSPPGEYVVQEDGSFRVRIPGDRPVTISPWHPRLQPASNGGMVETTLGREGVELLLVDDLGVVIPAPQLEGVVRQGVRVGVAATGDPRVSWFHAGYGDGAIRFGTRPPNGPSPGRHTITLDPGSRFAPLMLPPVDIGAGLTELDPVTFEIGSTLRVQILTSAGSDPPRIYVSARRKDLPDYIRGINSNGERVVELTGLGPGRFQVYAAAIMTRERRLEQELSVDGKSVVTLVLDLR